MVFAVLMEGLQAFMPDRSFLLSRGRVQRSRGSGGGPDC